MAIYIAPAAALLGVLITLLFNYFTQKNNIKSQRDNIRLNLLLNIKSESLIEFNKTLYETTTQLQYFYSKEGEFQRRQLLNYIPRDPYRLPMKRGDYVYDLVTEQTKQDYIDFFLPKARKTEDSLKNLKSLRYNIRIYLDEKENKQIDILMRIISELCHQITGNIIRMKQTDDTLDFHTLIDSDVSQHFKQWDEKLTDNLGLTQKIIKDHLDPFIQSN